MIDKNLIIKKIESADDLPTLPTIISKIIQTIKNPNSSAKQIGDLISQDQALAAKTLRLVNSAFYGFPGKISNITRAIVILGFNKVRSIALSASVIDTFKVKRTTGFDYTEFWKHSLGVGICSEQIINIVKPQGVFPEDGFIAGLIHDIGKIVIANYLSKEFRQIFDIVNKGELLIMEAEKKVIGMTHSVVGSMIAKKWQFPDVLADPIRFHHLPLSAPPTSRVMVYVIHTADIITRALMIGFSGDNLIPPIENKVWDYLGISKGILEKIVHNTLQNVEKAKIFLELIKKQ